MDCVDRSPQEGGGGSAPLTAAVFRQLIDQLGDLESRLYLPEVPLDDQSILEGYKWIFTILAVGLDAHVWADPGPAPFRGHRRSLPQVGW